MIDWIIRKWDMVIYRLACSSFCRLCRRNPGYAYLVELSINRWLFDNPMPESLKKSTEEFFKVITEHEETEK